jgi:glycosyltransferase involved in cell wall biosynthesis
LAAYEDSTPEILRWVKEEVTPAAFNRADAVVLPNDGILKIYDGLLNKSTKILYLPSGSKHPRHVAQIPLDPHYLYFLYIGRRLPIKGFDLIIEAFKRAYMQRSEIRLILLGNGEKIDLDGVIDIGFSNAPHDWMASTDYVITANRQSYFDLAVLEALSVGAPLLLSCTWGHCVFKNASPGIFDIGAPNVQNIQKAFLTFPFKRELNMNVISANQELFRRQYSDEVYRRSLDRMLHELAQGECGAEAVRSLASALRIHLKAKIVPRRKWI